MNEQSHDKQMLRDAVDDMADALGLPLAADEPVAILAVQCRNAVVLERDGGPGTLSAVRRARRRRDLAARQREEAQAQRAVLLPWELGKVMEDRWGLRWRADVRVPSGGEGWACRSAGFRAWRTTEQMLVQRAPLTHVRTDRVFGGLEAAAERQASEAEDAAVRVADADAAEVTS